MKMSSKKSLTDLIYKLTTLLVVSLFCFKANASGYYHKGEFVVLTQATVLLEDLMQYSKADGGTVIITNKIILKPLTNLQPSYFENKYGLILSRQNKQTLVYEAEHIEDIYQGPLNYKFAPNLVPAIAEKLKAINVPVTPTLNIYYQLTKLSDEKEAFLATIPTEYTSDIVAFEAINNQVERWLTSSDEMAAHNRKTLKFLQHITKVFFDAEIPLLVGSDSGVLLSPHGLATHNEMSLMHESGMAIYDVLAAATINPAKALNMGDQIGKVSEGYTADFILSKESPVDDLSILERPEAVVKNGHFYSKKALKELRENAIESRSIWSELKTLYRGM